MRPAQSAATTSAPGLENADPAGGAGRQAALISRRQIRETRSRNRAAHRQSGHDLGSDFARRHRLGRCHRLQGRSGRSPTVVDRTAAIRDAQAVRDQVAAGHARLSGRQPASQRTDCRDRSVGGQGTRAYRLQRFWRWHDANAVSERFGSIAGAVSKYSNSASRPRAVRRRAGRCHYISGAHGGLGTDLAQADQRRASGQVIKALQHYISPDTRIGSVGFFTAP